MKNDFVLLRNSRIRHKIKYNQKSNCKKIRLFFCTFIKRILRKKTIFSSFRRKNASNLMKIMRFR